MTDSLKRVSQDSLAELLDSAVKLETQRIEQLNAAMVDQVAGGVVLTGVGGISLPGTDFGGTTMGIFATDVGQ